MSNFIQEQNKQRTDFYQDTKFKREITIVTIFCNKISKGVLFLSIFATVCPILVYYYVINQSPHKETDTYSCLVESGYRIPCGSPNVSSESCIDKLCCYDVSVKSCYHYLPSKYYYIHNDNTGQYSASRSMSPLDTKSVDDLKVIITDLSENQVSITLQNGDVKDKANTITHKNYQVELVETKLMVQVTRNDGNDILLTTSKGPLIASEKYWEWSFYLTNQTIFGLGQTLIQVDANTTLTKVIYKNQDDHSTLPVLWAHLNGKFHGVVVNHDGPLEIEILPSNLVILRSLTGEKIELILSIGPTPSDLHSQQKGAFNLPPSWALGTHVCRKGSSVDLGNIFKEYGQTSTTNDLDINCIHENLVMALSKNPDDDTIEELKNYLKSVTDSGQKFMVSLPPHILANSENPLYTTAKNLGVLYKNHSEIYIGKFMGEDVAYPDFTHTNISDFTTALKQFLDSNIGLENISGFILNDNWPTNVDYNIKGNESFPYFSEILGNSENPLYTTAKELGISVIIEFIQHTIISLIGSGAYQCEFMKKHIRSALSLTIPWNLNVSSGNTQHIKYHNQYGSAHFSLISDLYTNTSDDVFIMSATKNFGEVQSTMLENENTSWSNMNATLRKVLFDSISGNHFVSVPICGDTSNYDKSLQEVLCMRWYLLAATMPIFRVNSYSTYRDPDNLNSGFATNCVKSAIQTRKQLQAYFYTILSKDEPLVRPMFYDFYDEQKTFSIDWQYMIGRNMLVAHPFSSGRTKLQIYLPKKVSVWYEFFAGNMYEVNDKNNTISFDILETDWISFIAQGSIVPLVDGNTINLIVALKCDNSLCNAEGELFLENSLVQISGTNPSVSFDNLSPTTNSYTLGYIKVYSYKNSVGIKNHYDKNIEFYNDQSGTTATIWFEEQTTTEPPTTTTEPTTTTKSTTTTEPSTTKEPTTITEPTTTTEPSTTKEPTTITEPTTTTEPSTTKEPTTITEPTNTTEPSTKEPTTITEPSTTKEPTTITEPTNTTEPSTTKEPTTITEPTNTTEFSTTKEPTTITESITTTDPSTTTEPNTTSTTSTITLEPSTTTTPQGNTTSTNAKEVTTIKPSTYESSTTNTRF